MYIEGAGRLVGRLIAAFIGIYIVAGVVGATRADAQVSPPPGQEIAPVPHLFERVHATFSGRILKVELELADPPAYEVKLLTESGNVLMLSYDAMTLRLDSVIGHRDTDDEMAAVTLAGDSDDADDAGDERDDDDDQADADDDSDDRRDGRGSDDPSGPGGGDDDDGDNSGPGGGDDHDGDDGSGGGNSGPGGGGDD